ncbi:MAG: helix-turn-helix domain-containing protein [Alistipes sp.]|nr:helix-turn-helix domain-containing protein [Alistipes sp.]
MENFQIIHPSALLKPYIKHYWFLNTNDATQPVQRIIPTGYVSLIFHRGENLFSISKGEQQPKAFMSGQTRGYSDIQQKGMVDMISVTFQPHGTKAFFALPLNELFELTLSVDDMGDPALIELQNCLMDAPDVLSCVRLIEAFLIKRLNVVKAYNHERMSAVMEAINAGENNIEKLARISCLSYKQFKRIFSEYIGANPRDFLRIIRFQKALYTLQIYPGTNFTKLAGECGYYDQPHFVNEFKAFTGYTPSQFISIWAPYSDYFT